MATSPPALYLAKCFVCFMHCVGSHWTWPSSNSWGNVSPSTWVDWRGEWSQLFRTRYWFISHRIGDFWWLYATQTSHVWFPDRFMVIFAFATHCCSDQTYKICQEKAIATVQCPTDVRRSHLNLVLLCSFPSKQLRLCQWACSSSQAACCSWSPPLCCSVTWKAGRLARASILPSLPSVPLVLEIMWWVSRQSKQALMWWKDRSGHLWDKSAF